MHVESVTEDVVHELVVNSRTGEASPEEVRENPAQGREWH